MQAHYFSHRLRRAWLCALAAACLAGGLSACSRSEFREERYVNGSLKSKDAFMIAADHALIRHGIQLAWYPEGGKESMETYVIGYRQGYSFRWYPNGRMKSVEHFTDGRRDGQAKFWDEAGRITACFTPEGADCTRALAAEASASRLALTP